MEKSAFPGCCAGRILHDFGSTGLTLGYDGKFSKEEIKNFLTKTEHWSIGFYLIALNWDQVDYIGPILLEHGYKCIAEEITSPSHPESVVFLYLKIT